jgi:hypothetical protein
MNAAHFHLMLNHVPVLGAIAVLALTAYALFKKNVEVTKLALMVAVLIGALSVPVFLSGEPAEEVVEHLAGVSENLIEAHEDFSLYALIMTEIVAVVGLYGLVVSKRAGQLPMMFVKVMVVLATLNAALMLYTANLGGQIRHTEIRKNGAPAQSEGSEEDSDHDDD